MVQEPGHRGERDEIDVARASRVFEHTVFTYDDENLQDGLGAQLQRILGIYAMTRALGAHYLHTPIKHLGFVGLSNPGGTSAEMLARVARLLPMTSDAAAIGLSRSARIERLNTLRLSSATELRGTAERPAVLRIAMPYPHLEDQPDRWRHLGTETGLGTSKAAHLRVALHVRRGELHLKSTSRDRLLPNSYYIAVAQRIGALLTGLNVRYRLELYTEAVDKPTIYSIEQLHGGEHATSLTIRPEDDRIDEFNVLSPLDRFINTDPIDTLVGLTTADVLITSKSSFSFVAGVLAPHNLVLYAPFWHHGLSDWVTTEPDGRFDETRAATKIDAILAMRREAAMAGLVGHARGV